MNKVCLIGRLTDNAKKIPSEAVEMISFTLAVTEGKENTSFISMVAFGSLADSISKYCAKGSLIAVEGSLRQRTYETKEGTKRSVTDVIVSSVDFLSKKPEAEEKPQAKTKAKAQANA